MWEALQWILESGGGGSRYQHQYFRESKTDPPGKNDILMNKVKKLYRQKEGGIKS